MAIQFTTAVQALTYQKVAKYLQGTPLFDDSLRVHPEQPKFHVKYGSTTIEIEIHPWEIHPWDKTELATVRATSCVTVNSSLEQDLMHYLLAENRRMRFGAFHLGDAGEVFFAESVLGGENMDMLELQTCILSVITIADTYNDIITQQFGGKRAVNFPGWTQD